MPLTATRVSFALENVCARTPAGLLVAGVIPDEHHRVELVVDARDHPEPARPRPHDSDVGRKLLDQQVLAVTVRIGDDDLRRAGGFRRGHGRQRFARHELAEPARYSKPAGPS